MGSEEQKNEPNPEETANKRGSAVEQVLGYLNFSSGTPDVQYLSALNELFQELTWQQVCETLGESLVKLESSSPAFFDANQAKHVLKLIPQFCSAYFQHHADLLSHQNSSECFNSFFMGRVTEILLATMTESAAGESQPPDTDAILSKSLQRLNDYIGYRPVATLESQKIEPYPHEWIRPVPLFVRGAGVAAGKYEKIVRHCISLLESTHPSLLRAAYFDPDRMHELAIDPRAYDFDHPANKRPNHHFGLWDPHQIDGQGFYTRFVVQQINIDALLSRVERGKTGDGLDEDELIFEAAAVLAGTVLMSSGISGYGPETHASTVSLGGLLAQIAAYRDEFYRQLISSIEGSHGARLLEEATRLQQPFAAARQDLNRQLTEHRATQLQRVQLARLYARMRYDDEANAQAARIQVPSARIATQIDCHLSAAKSAIADGELTESLTSIRAARSALLRGIDCGAFVDPWNILGFDANFSLFGPIENSLRDFRIDDLVDVVEEMHELLAQLWSKAAAAQRDEFATEIRACFRESANWWYQFAAHELDSVDAENPLAVYEAAENVALALQAWHREGETTGDIGFWSPYVEKFDSCRAYWLVVNTLLARHDKIAALGLLMHWLSRSESIPLEHGETSFFQLSLRWLESALSETGTLLEAGERVGWVRIRKFFDYLEANAGELLDVPDFRPDAENRSSNGPQDQSPNDSHFNESELFDDGYESEFPTAYDEEDEDDRFSAAYENVVYRDSTDDGMDGSVFDFDAHDEDYLQQASRPIATRLAFIEQLSLVWRLLSVTWCSATATGTPDASNIEVSQSMDDLLQSARRQLGIISADLGKLTSAIANYKLSRPGADPEAMVNYDRLRMLKDSLLDQVVNTTVAVTEALRFITASIDESPRHDVQTDHDRESIRMLRACLHNDTKTAEQLWPAVRASFHSKPILYVPLNRNGKPNEIVAVRSRQHFIQDLIYWLPRLGLLKETYQLLEQAREMELTPVGVGAITEFDDLFEVGYRSIVNALIDASEADRGADDNQAHEWLVATLEDLLELMLRGWLAHSRTLRLSVLEQTLTGESWKSLERFIQDFGRDLFTQRFLNIGNLRGILHQGVEVWLRMIEEREEPEYQTILDALENGTDRKEFVEMLTFVLEAIVENYAEYRDYNSTTTQSDRGDLLYTLLDFLRLRVSYDRVVWNLRPVVLAHQVLANRGHEEAAERWRKSLQEKIHAEAKRHAERLAILQKKYAMQLPSISKRISEKFMRPLQIDYLCALIEPAMYHENHEAKQSAFERIREQAETFMQEPSGAGLDVPTWLLTMEDTIRAVSDKHEASMQRLLETYMLPPVTLSTEEIQTNLQSWETRLLEQSDDLE